MDKNNSCMKKPKKKISLEAVKSKAAFTAMHRARGATSPAGFRRERCFGTESREKKQTTVSTLLPAPEQHRYIKLDPIDYNS